VETDPFIFHISLISIQVHHCIYRGLLSMVFKLGEISSHAEEINPCAE